MCPAAAGARHPPPAPRRRLPRSQEGLHPGAKHPRRGALGAGPQCTSGWEEEKEGPDRRGSNRDKEGGAEGGRAPAGRDAKAPPAPGWGGGTGNPGTGRTSSPKLHQEVRPGPRNGDGGARAGQETALGRPLSPKRARTPWGPARRGTGAGRGLRAPCILQPPPTRARAPLRHLFLLQVAKFLVDDAEDLLHGLRLHGARAAGGVLRSRRCCYRCCYRCGGRRRPGCRCRRRCCRRRRGGLAPGGSRGRWRPRRLAAAPAVAGGRGHLGGEADSESGREETRQQKEKKKKERTRESGPESGGGGGGGDGARRGTKSPRNAQRWGGRAGAGWDGAGRRTRGARPARPRPGRKEGTGGRARARRSERRRGPRPRPARPSGRGRGRQPPHTTVQLAQGAARRSGPVPGRDP